MASPSLTKALRETLALFDDSGAPQTTTEVAERLDLGRRSTYERLERLVEHDRLETKKVGANGRVWWRAPTATVGQPVDTSQQQTTEQALIHDVFDTAAVGVFVLDENFEVEWINNTTERYFGLRRDDVIGRDKSQLVMECIAPRIDDGDAFEETVLATYDDNTYTEKFECHVMAGEEREARWLEHRSMPVESGAYAGGRVELYYDVTERKDYERQLRTFRKAVEASGHSVYFTDSNGIIEYVNPAFEETTGYSAEEVIGENPRFLKSGEQDPDFYDELWGTILAGDMWQGELINTTKDGDRYAIEQTIAPVTDESGEIEHFVAVNMDITERRDRQRRYEAIFNGTYQYTGLMDPDGTLIEINKASLEFGGIDRAEVVGEKFWNAYWFQQGEAAERIREAVERARDGEFARLELEVRGTDRTAVIDFSIRPVTDDHGEIIYLIPEGRDITDRVDAERELRRHRDQLATLNHINTIVHDVTDAVIKQSTRPEIERAVCEDLIEEDTYDVAWIGDVDRDQRNVIVRTAAGVQGTLDEMKIPVDSDDEHGTGPTASAYRTGTIHVENGIDTESRHDLWRDDVEASGNRSIAGIPLVYDDTVYGVLTVYADRPNAFGKHEQVVLAQLGELVGQAIAAGERKQALMSDEIVELEFHVPDVFESMGVDASADGRIVLDDVVATSDEAYLVYGTMAPDARDTLDALTDQHAHWDSVIAISEEEDGIRFQARVTELPLQSGVASEGGSIEEVLFEDGALHLRINLPSGGDMSAITETVEGTFPTARLLGKRQIPRPQDPVIDIRKSLSEELTDRQRAALEAAYHQGYFEWPRDTTGQEVADSLGIAPPTFSQHLRRAEKAVVESVFSFSTLA
jgi:PAS domain S-box-containing protein